MTNGIPVPLDLILFSPLGFSLFMSVWILLVFIFIVFIKTPAWTFLSAGFGKNMVFINPGEDKILRFQKGKRKGGLAHVKKRGYYLINPNDVYIEGGSKTPIAIAWGNFAVPINMEMAKIAERLKLLGLKNWEHLMKFIEGMKKRNEEELAKGKKGKPETLMINVLGESVPIDVAVDYFNRNERSDIIESEIQRRTATEVMKKVGTTANLGKWFLICGIVAMLVFVGYAVLMTAFEGGGDTVTIAGSELQELLNMPKVISGETGATGLE